jgi:hypothetical protein
MDTIHFPATELPHGAEPVDEGTLQVGKVYFWLNYFDEELLVPDFRAVVFVGRDEEGCTYFQDVLSYDAGVRIEAATDENSCIEVCAAGSANHIFDGHKVISELMKWSLRWRNCGR